MAKSKKETKKTKPKSKSQANTSAQASQPAQNAAPVQANIKPQKSHTACIVLVIIGVLFVVGIIVVFVGLFVLRGFDGFRWPAAPDLSSQSSSFDPALLETPNSSGSATQVSAAENSLANFMSKMVSQNYQGAANYCTSNYKNADFMKKLLAGSKTMWQSYKMGTPSISGSGYTIPLTITTGTFAGSGPTATFDTTAEMIDQNGLWLVNNLSNTF